MVRRAASPARQWASPAGPGVVGAVGALLFAVVLLGWTLASPLMSAPDEAAHTVRAVAVAHGQLRGHDVVTTATEPDGVSSTVTDFTVPAGYADLPSLSDCFVVRPDLSAGCAPEPTTLPGRATATTYAGTYPPLWYALVGWPSLVADPPTALWLMRLASVAVSAALVGLALAGARRTDGGGVVVAGLLVATTPMACYLASVLNPSGAEILAALALWCCALALVRPADRTTGGDVGRAAVAFVATAGVRGLSPLLAVGIVAAVVLVAGRRGDGARLARAPGARPVAAVVGVAFALCAAWTLWSRAYTAITGSPLPGLSLGDAFRGSLSRLLTRLRQMVGWFAYLNAPPPPALVVLWGVLGGGVTLAALVAGTARRRAGLLALVAATVAFSVVPEALRAEQFGYVWQGRYSLPVAVGIPVLGAWIVGRASWWREGWAAPTAAVVACLWVLGQVLGLATTLRRFVLGTGTDLFDFMVRQRWDPPLPPVVLVALVMGGGLAFGAWAVVGGDPGPGAHPRRDEADGGDEAVRVGPGAPQPTTERTTPASRVPNASSP